MTFSLASMGFGQDYEFYKKYGHKNKRWNEAVKEGFAAYDAGDCVTALKFLNEAISQQAQDALIYFKIAVCTEQTGSPYSAIQYYQLAEDNLQKLPEIHHYQKDIFENYGRALFKAKRYQEALPYLSRAAAVGTPSFGLYYMIGFLHSQKDDFDAAISYFRKALTQDTTDIPPKLLSQVYLEVGKSHYQKKEYPQALEHFKKAIQLDPENREANELQQKTQTLVQQASMVEMIQTLTDKAMGKKEDTTQGSHIPPAASKLPPLEGPHPQGTTETQTSPAPPKEEVPGQLSPLPPPPP